MGQYLTRALAPGFALVPGGLSAGLLAPRMISGSVAAVEPALDGAASAAFNASRQVGAAIGIATFGPLLGTTHDLKNGFIACVVNATATEVTLVLTSLAKVKFSNPSNGK